MELFSKRCIVFFRVRAAVGILMHHLSLRLCGVMSKYLDKLWKVLTVGTYPRPIRCLFGEASYVEVDRINDMRHTITERSNTLLATSSFKEDIVVLT